MVSSAAIACASVAVGGASALVWLREYVARGMREALPKPSGPHVPGSVDVKCRETGLVFRLFYPSVLAGNDWPSTSLLDRWLPGSDATEQNVYALEMVRSLGLKSAVFYWIASFISSARIRAICRC